MLDAVSTQQATSVAEERTALGPGRLRVRAIDARSGALLDHVQVRAASPTRIAERGSEVGSTVVELALTPGTYALLVSCRGYEPVELAGLAIPSGSVVEPEPLPMQAAGARIVGAVRSDAGPERRLRAELLGIGASRCDLRPDGSFGFENLAGGNYTLRLIDGGERTVGLPQALVLQPFESRTVELTAFFLRASELELLDTDGSSLASVWAARLGGKEAEADTSDIVTYEEVREDSRLDFECVFRSGETCVGKTTVVPPLPPGTSVGGTSIGISGHHGSRPGRQRAGVDDRARGPDEALRPETPAPVIEPPVPHVRFDPQGLVRFEPLPSLPLVLEMSCGAFEASIEIPASAETTRVRGELKARGAGPRTYREHEARALAH